MSFNELKQHGTEDFPFGIYVIDKHHPKYEMAFHWHTNVEIIRVISGTLSITLDNCNFTAKRGDVVFVNSEIVHGATPHECEYECLVFPLSFLKNGNRACNRFLDDLIEKNCKLAHLPSGEEIKEITLDDMALAAGFSTKYFCSFFKELTGKTPVEYLNSYRVERACRKLLGSDLSITQIAYGSGFNDLSYFIKTFKKIKGSSPSIYRKTIT